MRDCSTLDDRKACLTSIESRNQIEAGGEIHGSECAWCESGPCTTRNASMCKPESMLQALGEVGYETCLEVEGQGNDNSS